ncbi:hypothetical protein C8R47DRAFT_1108771 [Mycena vitilis]|nr:hypothetical protein C8R47DRAFT_1108771 [Mycena vitilis]
MHRCLEVAEISTNVAECLRTEVPYGDAGCSYPDSVSLARLARTCRFLSNISLDILWREPGALTPLLCCFPQRLWKKEGISRRRMPFRIRSVIEPGDWDRVLIYGDRIRAMPISCCGSEDEIALSEIFELLSVASPVAHLLPKLRSVSWKIDAPLLFHFIVLFLPPSITSFSCHINTEPASMSLVLRLPAYLPNLTHLDLVPRSASDLQISREVATCLQGLNHLESVSVPVLLPTALKRLGSLSTLQDLAACSVEGCEPPEHGTFGGFPAMRSLHVETEHMESGVNLLQWCDNTPLESLTFVCFATATAAVSSEFLATLRQRCSHHDLTCIHIHCVSETPPPATLQYAITREVLQPLLVFRNITRLTVLSSGAFSLDDHFVLQMSMAWPRCTHIQLHSTGQTPSATGGITLSALTAFAERCPLLKYLALDIDCAIAPCGPHPSPHSARARQTSLETLAVGRSPIEHPGDVAHYLSSIFPALSHIYAERHESRWLKVADLVPKLAAARAAEIGFWMAGRSQRPGDDLSDS